MKSVRKTESPLGGPWEAWRPGEPDARAPTILGPPPSCREPCPSGPDSRQAGRIFRNLGGIRGPRAGGVALPHSTPLLDAGRGDPVVRLGPRPSSLALPGKGRGFPPVSCLPPHRSGAGPGSHSFLELGARRLPCRWVGGCGVPGS